MAFSSPLLKEALQAILSLKRADNRSFLALSLEYKPFPPLFVLGDDRRSADVRGKYLLVVDDHLLSHIESSRLFLFLFFFPQSSG